MIKLKPYLYLTVIMAILTLTACAGNSEKPQASPSELSKQAKPEVFTADEGGSITEIDAATNKAIHTISLEGIVHNVQVTPDGKVVGAVLIPNMDMNGQGHDSSMKMSGFALFFDTATDQLIKKVEVGNHPAHIVFTQDGKYVLVTNNEDNNVSVIDAKTYQVFQTISTGKGPHGFRISPDSKLAYVANMGEDTVSVLDLNNLKELKKIKVGQTPVTTGITSDGKMMVATINGENALAIVDLKTDKVEKVKVGAGPAQVYIEPDNKFAWVANQGTASNPSHTVTKIDLLAKKAVATIQTGKGSHGVVASDDNKFIYVTNMFDNTVSVINTNENKVINTIQVGKTPNGISFKGE
jgi:YVTN family beta-propeller protein